MKTFDEKEKELAERLRDLCNKEGQELYPKESGKVINKLGLLYKTKSPDKISLIQSATLLNAAIVRQPSNGKFQKDLEDLCQHVLECAGAENINAGLVKIAKEIAEMATEMREETRRSLENIKPIQGIKVQEDVIGLENTNQDQSRMDVTEQERNKIKSVKETQDRIAQRYTEMMAFTSGRCIKIMGIPPCKYALVGMGSLARKEVTPYSDFEHIIVLEEFIPLHDRELILEYFRWYSVIFHIVVLNLQETIIPSVNIRCLNDSSTPNGDWFFDKITTRGISFDGMMPHACKFPLGRTYEISNKPCTELIKPVSEMVTYLDVEEDLKNGYHLADILTKTCFIAGDENIYKMFCEKANEIQKKPSLERCKLVFFQLQEDFCNFSMANYLIKIRDRQFINIKRMIYRSVTLFVCAMGQLNICCKNTNFAILEDLQERNIIDVSVFHDLSLAVAVACLIRLYWYMAKNTQQDTIPEYLQKYFYSEKIKSVFNVVSNQEHINFFSTVLLLQMVADGRTRNLNEFFSENSVWTKLAIKKFLGPCEEVVDDDDERHLQIRDDKTIPDLAVLFYEITSYVQSGNLDKSIDAFILMLNYFKHLVPHSIDYFDFTFSVKGRTMMTLIVLELELENNNWLSKLKNYFELPTRLSTFQTNLLLFLSEFQKFSFFSISHRDHEALSAICKIRYILPKLEKSLLFPPPLQNIISNTKDIYFLILISVFLFLINHTKQALHHLLECLEVF